MSSRHPAVELYRALTSLGLSLTTEDDRLLISPAGRLTGDTATLIREFKIDLITLVNYPPLDDRSCPSVRGCPVCLRLTGWHAKHDYCEGPPAPGSIRSSFVLQPQTMAELRNELKGRVA